MSADTRQRRQEPAYTLDLPEVYSATELADASGVRPWVVAELIACAEIPTVDGEHVAFSDASEAVLAIKTGRLRAHPAGARPGVFGSALVDRRMRDSQSQQVSALMSTGLHMAVILLVVFLTTVRLTTAFDDTDEILPQQLTRLIFLAEPGPGGGGGGGGLRMPTAPPPAERKGARTVSSPVPARVEPRLVEPVTDPEPPKPLDNESLPPIFAPLVAAPADSRDIRGLLTDVALETPPESDEQSQGPGFEGGVGSGAGTGIGSGSGSGIGPGSGGGTGGGPYRPGSGITPPRLTHEERPHYTEAARRRGVEGSVVLEIVVRSDGSVGDIRVLRGVEAGLDQQAIAAVRQWRFDAAERFGTPVDVLVEVSVEFRLR
jgi:protein TonB